MFVTGVTKLVHVDGVDVTVKKLSWKQLKKANAAARKEGVEAAREAGAELVKAFRELSNAEAAGEITSEMKRQARYRQYDVDIVLFLGVKEWGGAEVTSEAIDALSPEVATQLHEAILDFSLPLLGEEAKAAPKGSAPLSIST